MDNFYDPAHVCGCGMVHEPGTKHHDDLHQDTLGASTPSGLKGAVDDLRNRVAPMVRARVDQLAPVVREKATLAREKADQSAIMIRNKAQLAGWRARSYMRSNPAVVAGVSAGLGLIAGMIASAAVRRNRHLGIPAVKTRSSKIK